MDDKLITREDALNAIDRIWDRCEEIEAHLPEGDPDKTGYKMITDYLTVWKYLYTQPKIIHCKDCKYAKIAHNAIWCDKNGGYYDPVKHFCSMAERRNDD